MEALKKYIQSLTDFSEESFLILEDCITEFTIKKGKSLLKTGEICNSIFFIISGYCKSTYNKDGKDINTAFYFENEFATNIKSLREGSKSDYAIVACEALHMISFDKAALLNAYKKSPQIETFGRKVLEIIVVQQEEHSNLFKIYSPAERYQYLLENKPEYLQRISLSQLASYFGITRETLSRIRKKRYT